MTATIAEMGFFYLISKSVFSFRIVKIVTQGHQLLGNKSMTLIGDILIDCVIIAVVIVEVGIFYLIFRLVFTFSIVKYIVEISSDTSFHVFYHKDCIAKVTASLEQRYNLDEQL